MTKLICSFRLILFKSNVSSSQKSNGSMNTSIVIEQFFVKDVCMYVYQNFILELHIHYIRIIGLYTLILILNAIYSTQHSQTFIDLTRNDLIPLNYSNNIINLKYILVFQILTFILFIVSLNIVKYSDVKFLVLYFKKYSDVKSSQMDSLSYIILINLPFIYS